MKNRMEEQTHQIYVPVEAIQCATIRSSWNRLPVAWADEPDTICGLAHRIGYTGTSDHDLAIYRLKVKGRDERSKNKRRTLAALFVLEDGVFQLYEQWRLKHDFARADEGETPTGINLERP